MEQISQHNTLGKQANQILHFLLQVCKYTDETENDCFKNPSTDPLHLFAKPILHPWGFSYKQAQSRAENLETHFADLLKREHLHLEMQIELRRRIQLNKSSGQGPETSKSFPCRYMIQAQQQ